MQRRFLIGLAILLGATVSVGAQQAIFTDEIYLGSQPCRMLSGSGDPEGSVTAAPCSIYLRTSDGMIWRKATGTGNTGWVEVGLPTGSANQVLFHNGSAIAFSGTPTVTSLTASSLLSSPQLTASGNLTIDPTGDLTLDPGGTDVLPGSGYTNNFGSFTRKWLTLHAAELWVSTLVAQDVMSTVGGRVVVAPTTELTADLAAGSTLISVKHNNLAIGDRLFLEANGMFEAMAVATGPFGSGPYIYSVTRDLDGSGANNWPAGSAVLNTGTTGDGLIDLYADHGLVPGSTHGPTIVGNVRTGTTYSDLAPRWAIGNLNGLYGYATDIYGAAFGDPSNAWLKIDATNGVRIGHGSTTLTEIDASGNASFTGSITSTSGSIGSWSIDATSLSATDVGLYAERFYTSALDLDGGNENASRSFASFTTDNFTLGAWVYVDAITTTHYPIYIGDFAGGGAGRNGYGILVAAGANTFQGVFFNPSGNVFIGSAPVTIGQWTHVALRRQGGISTLFVNGAPAGSTSTSAPVPPNGRFTVGALYSSGSYTNGLDGRVAHVFLTHQALSNSAIAAMATGGPSGSGLAPFLVSPGDYATQTPLLHYFPLQGASNLAEYGGAGIGALTPTGTLGTASGPTVAVEWPRLEVGSGSSTAGVSRCLTGTDVALWAGAVHAGRASAPFRVTCAGALVATNATITGTITATSGSFTGTVNATSGSFTGSLTSSSGTIAGLTLASGSMTATNLGVYSGAANTARIEIGTGAAAGGLNSCNGSGDIGLWIGQTHGNRASAPFRVTCGGTLTATNATITGSFSTNSIGITDANGVVFANATSATDYSRAIRWADGQVIMGRADINSLHMRGPGGSQWSQINLYPTYIEFWGGTTAGGNGLRLSGSALYPFNKDLSLGLSDDPWNGAHIEGTMVLYDQLPLTFNHANFKSGTQHLCVDSAGRVFASPLGC